MKKIFWALVCLSVLLPVAGVDGAVPMWTIEKKLPLGNWPDINRQLG